MAGYRGSVCSKRYRLVWKDELVKHPERFTTKVLSLHETRQQAVDKEVFFQRQLNVVKNELYTNAALATGRPSLKGVKKTAEHCRNLSIAKKGKYVGRKMPPRDDEWRKKQREANFGKKASLETKAKMSEAHKGRKHSPETLAKIRAAALKRWAQANAA